MLYHYDLPGGVPATCEHHMLSSTLKNLRRASGKRIDVESLNCTRIDLTVPTHQAEMAIEQREAIAQQIIAIAKEQGITLPLLRKVQSKCPKADAHTYSLLLNDRSGKWLPVVQAALQTLSG